MELCKHFIKRLGVQTVFVTTRKSCYSYNNTYVPHFPQQQEKNFKPNAANATFYASVHVQGISHFKGDALITQSSLCRANNDSKNCQRCQFLGR
jgi:hypothetical protein